MHPAEIESCLASFRVLVDTREQPSARARRRYADFGCPAVRRKLEYGDYTYEFDLPSGESIYPDNEKVNPIVCIERKMDLDELAMCLTSQRNRFRAEMERATEAGCRIYLLIENASWENLMNGRYKSKMHPNAFKASVTAWTARYKLVPIFCKAETSGLLIKEILYRELKERLESGYYG